MSVRIKIYLARQITVGAKPTGISGLCTSQYYWLYNIMLLLFTVYSKLRMFIHVVSRRQVGLGRAYTSWPPAVCTSYTRIYRYKHRYRCPKGPTGQDLIDIYFSNRSLRVLSPCSVSVLQVYRRVAVRAIRV